MAKKAKKALGRLAPEEERLEAAFEHNEFRSVAREEIGRTHKSAAEFVAAGGLKDRRITIRLRGRDLLRIKQIAAREGLPYQTLIGSILHKFSQEA
jgi:predicted DNA binding CopG/RHH family protein